MRLLRRPSNPGTGRRDHRRWAGSAPLGIIRMGDRESGPPLWMTASTVRSTDRTSCWGVVALRDRSPGYRLVVSTCLKPETGEACWHKGA
jgi:hypothetical protein